jgi:hypothetical protein
VSTSLTARAARPLFYAFMLVTLADVVSTVVGLGLGAEEANPTMLALFDQLGLGPAMALKTTLAALSGWSLARTMRTGAIVRPGRFADARRRSAMLTAIGAVVITSLVVASNTFVVASLVHGGALA